jgi:hypothetical protein
MVTTALYKRDDVPNMPVTNRIGLNQKQRLLAHLAE